MHLPLVLLRVTCHVIRVDEVACYFIHREGFSETLGGLLVLGDAEDADFLGGFWREAALLLEGGCTAVIGLRHDCVGIWSKNDFVGVSVRIRREIRGEAKE